MYDDDNYIYCDDKGFPCDKCGNPLMPESDTCELCCEEVTDAEVEAHEVVFFGTLHYETREPFAVAFHKRCLELLGKMSKENDE